MILWEVEQKFPIQDPLALRNRLSRLGAEWGHSLEQVDRYFNHPARDFAVTDEALRLRSVDTENWVTYKGPKLDATTKTRREIELPLAPGVHLPDRYHELLEALGFCPVLEVRKRRTPGELLFQDKKITLAWDEVVGLGNFLEIELMATDGELSTAKAILGELAQTLELVHSERRSYLELLLVPQS
ncbi:MAG: class IV adenylate cyclase [Pirellulales bacterium]|nr:class IV adenylate cyclase [Pirellulales bacterium]